MDQENVKKRDVMSFDEFAESYDQARKVVMLKKGENAHPGAHQIKGEGLYVRNDANPYKAFGIEHNEKEADVNMRMNANRVHLFDQTKNDRVEVITQNKPLDDCCGKSAGIVNNMQTRAALDESEAYDKDALDKAVKFDNEDEQIKG